MFERCKICGKRKYIGVGWVQIAEHLYCRHCQSQITSQVKTKKSSTVGKPLRPSKRRSSSKVRFDVYDSYGRSIPPEFMKPVTIGKLKKPRRIKSKMDIPRGYYDRSASFLLCRKLARSKYAGEDREFYKRIPQENPFLEIIVIEEEKDFVPIAFAYFYFHGTSSRIPNIHAVYEV